MKNIPKIIHYCWLGAKPLGRFERHCIETWKTKMPEYKIIHWNIGNMPLEEYPFLSTLVKEKKWAYASDIIRLHALYINGGWYFDTDVEILEDLTDFEKSSPVLCYEDEKIGLIEGHLIGSLPGDNFIKACLDALQKIHLKKKPIITLPNVITGAYADSKEKVRILPQHYFSPGEYHMTRKQRLQSGLSKGKVYAIHHFKSNWRNKRFHIKRFLKKIIGFTSKDGKRI